MTEAPSSMLFGWSPLWVATTILILAYAVIIMDRINRAIVAVTGATIVVALGVLTQEQAVRAIDFNTIGLLIGMMVVVNVMAESGIFQFLAIKAAKVAGGNPWGILVMLSVITAALSAFLNNVTVVLMVGPVTLLIAEELKINPYPLLFAEILASNTGGTATLIGDPPNTMIGSAAGLSFNQFIFHMTPLILVVFAATMVPLWVVYGRYMTVTATAKDRLLAFNEYEVLGDRRLVVQCASVFGLVLLAFVVAEPLHLELATIAMIGAAVLLGLVTWKMDGGKAAHKVQEIFMGVEWVTIFFFLGLFVIVAGVQQAGLLKLLAQWVLSLTDGDFAVTAMAILWASAILSALVDNIPFVITMIPLIKDLLPAFHSAGIPTEQLNGIWWALAAGACLGGNGTLVGAAANLVTAGFAERHGVPFRYLPFLKVAFPIMLFQIAICAVYIWLRYL